MNDVAKIRILGIDYGVRFSDLRKDNGNSDFGNVVHSNCRINIHRDNRTISEFEKTTLLHEIIEELNFRLELNLPHTQITQLEAGMIQVIRDNPELIEILSS